MKFSLGQVVITRSALSFCDANKVNAFGLLARHQNGDWGDLGDSDRQMNEAAVQSGKDRIFSAYDFCGERWYIITEWDRSSTCIMLASDY
jgi:hypothetical protein